ncbi:MAG: hypothetical protein Nk1A_5740 [Endomicrobiia bacterium]|nr:MAG: hypothetical protein Nk1A_5740 [Endomicrobiia bacterium]
MQRDRKKCYDIMDTFINTRKNIPPLYNISGDIEKKHGMDNCKCTALAVWCPSQIEKGNGSCETTWQCWEDKGGSRFICNYTKFESKIPLTAGWYKTVCKCILFSNTTSSTSPPESESSADASTSTGDTSNTSSETSHDSHGWDPNNLPPLNAEQKKILAREELRRDNRWHANAFSDGREYWYDLFLGGIVEKSTGQPVFMWGPKIYTNVDKETFEKIEKSKATGERTLPTHTPRPSQSSSSGSADGHSSNL